MVLLQKINAFYAFLGWWLKAGGILSAIILAATMVVYAMDRTPPFAVLSLEPVAARACEEVSLRAEVWRDPARACSVDLSRSFLDSSGKRYDLGNYHFSARALAELEIATPGRMSPRITIPCSSSLGDGAVITSREYSCNRVHAWLWPIEVTTIHPVTILPP